MNNALMVLNKENEELTMTHLQFAAITGKRNDNVKRVMKSLEDQEVISITQSEEPQSRGGKATIVYSVNERDSYIVMAQLSPKFTAQLVDEWKSMKEAKQEVAALPDFTNPAVAAIAWAEQYQAKEKLALEVKAKETMLIEQAPKVDFANAVTKADKNVVSMKDTAKALGLGRNTMMSILRDEKVLMRGNSPYQHYINCGYFVVRQSENNGHLSSTTFVTGKGEVWLHKFLTKKEYL